MSKAKISDEIRESIIKDWNNGETNKTQLGAKYGVSPTFVRSLVREIEASTVVILELETKKEEAVEETKKPLKRRDRNRMKKKAAKINKSKNAHQRNREYKKFCDDCIDDIIKEDELISQDIAEYQEPEPEEVDEVTEDGYFNIGNAIYPIEQYKLKKLERPSSTVEVGLVSDRHDINVASYIYGEINDDLMFDYDKLYEIAVDYINNNVSENQTLLLYCTGIQCALASVIKASFDLKRNLILKHYDSDNHNYKSQKIWEFYEISDVAFPFNKMLENGDPYLHDDLTVEEIMAAGKCYCISINTHDYRGSYTHCSYILVDDLNKAFSLLPGIVQAINDDINSGVRLSAFLTEVDVMENKFKWNNNLTKSYNFKN